MRVAHYLLVAALLASPNVGSALPLVPGGPTSNNDGVPDLYDVFNMFTGSHLTSNAGLVPLANSGTFTLGANTSAFLISSTADYSNSFGYYTRSGGLEIRNALFTDVTGFAFHGPPFALASFGVTGPVGLYLDANGEDVWHSESDLDAKTSDFDHLVTYLLGDIDVVTRDGTVHVTNAILLGWEDLNMGDADYDDLVAVIGDLPVPVPEPATGLYLGGALAALALHRRVRPSTRV